MKMTIGQWAYAKELAGHLFNAETEEKYEVNRAYLMLAQNSLRDAATAIDASACSKEVWARHQCEYKKLYKDLVEPEPTKKFVQPAPFIQKSVLERAIDAQDSAYQAVRTAESEIKGVSPNVVYYGALSANLLAAEAEYNEASQKVADAIEEENL